MKYYNIFQEYLPIYSKKLKNFNKLDLIDLIKKAELGAKKNYSELKPPVMWKENTYIENWIREIVDQNLTRLAMGKITIGKKYENPLYDLYSQYFSVLPNVLADKCSIDLYKTGFAKRRQKWESYDFPVDKLNELYKKILKQRNKEAKQDGYDSYLDFQIDVQKIPKKDFQLFVTNKERLVIELNNHLPKVKLPKWFFSVYGIPCYLCRLSEFPFKEISDVKGYFIENFSIIKKIQKKIDITQGDKAYVIYNKEKDKFDIFINKYPNIRHKTLTLVHEFCHVVNSAEDFQKGASPLSKDKYVREYEAIRTEFGVLQDLSDNLIKSQYADVLLNFRDTIFEINLYNNPDQDIGKLYAETLNACFTGAEQMSNPLYLLNSSFITKSLSSLEYSVAYNKILGSLLP